MYYLARRLYARRRKTENSRCIWLNANVSLWSFDSFSIRRVSECELDDSACLSYLEIRKEVKKMFGCESDAFYNNRRWLKIRQSVLKRDNYQCQLSKRYGKLVQANTVHHIFPRDDFPQYQYELWNLISVSAQKHNELHDRNTNQLTECGVDLLRRTARREGMEVPLRYR